MNERVIAAAYLKQLLEIRYQRLFKRNTQLTDAFLRSLDADDIALVIEELERPEGRVATDGEVSESAQPRPIPNPRLATSAAATAVRSCDPAPLTRCD
jgi:hypothetical protein